MRTKANKRKHSDLSDFSPNYEEERGEGRREKERGIRGYVDSLESVLATDTEASSSSHAPVTSSSMIQGGGGRYIRNYYSKREVGRGVGREMNRLERGEGGVLNVMLDAATYLLSIAIFFRSFLTLLHSNIALLSLLLSSPFPPPSHLSLPFLSPISLSPVFKVRA